MNKSLSLILIAIFGVGCLALTLFMPFTESGLIIAPEPNSVQAKQFAKCMPVDFLAQVPGLAGLKDIGDSVAKMPAFAEMNKDPNAPYYLYAVFLGVAMMLASVAINVIGREDAEEKTVLPVKK
jgi:hypothetical protein